MCYLLTEQNKEWDYSMITIGQEIYEIEFKDDKYVVVEKTLTGTVKRLDDCYEYYVDYTQTHKGFVPNHHQRYRLFTSKKKAENVAKVLNDERKRYDVIDAKRKKIKKYNEEWIKTLDVVGKYVMVYVGEGKWHKQQIKEIVPWEKKESYAFWGYSGWYVSYREGKNWYFWSELDELKRKKEKLEKQIKELEGL